MKKKKVDMLKQKILFFLVLKAEFFFKFKKKKSEKPADSLVETDMYHILCVVGGMKEPV